MTLLMMTPHASRGVKKQARSRAPRALVTGGAIRVGRAIALALARRGMDVAIGYHRSAREARRTVRDLEACGVRAVALRADLADPRAAARLVRDARRALGGLDVLVNSAAVFHRTPLATATPAQYDRFLDVNLRGVFFACQAAATEMPRGGHIVNIGDVGAERAWPSYIPYTISKAAVAALTRGLAVALRPRAIAVNCVAPGAVLRPVGFPLARWKAVTRGHEVGTDDVAAAVVFFATCPRNVTGQILDVD
jgi:NAD(P)-dependent dehydrogenase (short-subunit alcohol dehydrogenase family)